MGEESQPTRGRQKKNTLTPAFLGGPGQPTFYLKRFYSFRQTKKRDQPNKPGFCSKHITLSCQPKNACSIFHVNSILMGFTGLWGGGWLTQVKFLLTLKLTHCEQKRPFQRVWRRHFTYCCPYLPPSSSLISGSMGMILVGGVGEYGQSWKSYLNTKKKKTPN